MPFPANIKTAIGQGLDISSWTSHGWEVTLPSQSPHLGTEAEALAH